MQMRLPSSSNWTALFSIFLANISPSISTTERVQLDDQELIDYDRVFYHIQVHTLNEGTPLELGRSKEVK